QQSRPERSNQIDHTHRPDTGDAEGGEDQRQIVPKHQLQQNRRSSEQPDIPKSNGLHDGIAGTAHDVDDRSKYNPDKHGENRKDDGVRNTGQYRRHRHEAPKIVPLDLAVRKRITDQRQDGEDQKTGNPAPPSGTLDNLKIGNLGGTPRGRPISDEALGRAHYCRGSLLIRTSVSARSEEHTS